MNQLTSVTFLLILLLDLSFSPLQAQNVFQKKVFVTERGDTLPYQILYPQNYNKHKKYPVVLFLHGAGERGKDNERQMIHGSALFLDAKNQEKFPAIVLFPQCPENSFWGSIVSDRSVRPHKISFDYSRPITSPLLACIDLVNMVIKEEAVDKSRVYVMGLSMGGMGTLELISRYKNMFAAAIPICGGWDLSYIKELKKTPIWLTHGEKDDVVDVKNSRDIYAILKPVNSKVKYTEYIGVKHDSWTNTFAEPKLLSWLFKQRLKKRYFV